MVSCLSGRPGGRRQTAAALPAALLKRVQEFPAAARLPDRACTGLIEGAEGGRVQSALGDDRGV